MNFKKLFNKKKTEQIPEIPDLDYFKNPKYLTVVCHNTNEKGGDTVECVIFGAGEFSISNAQPNPAAHVEVMESSHAQARAMSMIEPFVVKGVRLIVSSRQQLSKVVSIADKTATGYTETATVSPLGYMTAAQTQSLQIDAPDLCFGVSYQTHIQIPVLAGEHVTVVMQIYKKGEMPLPTGVQTYTTVFIDRKKISNFKDKLRTFRNWFRRFFGKIKSFKVKSLFNK